MRAWLLEHWDWLCTAVFIAVSTSTTIGFKEGAKGAAILVSNTAAALSALALYPFLAKYGYGSEQVVLLGVFCGACGTALFGILIAVRGVVEKRRDRIANAIVSRVSPDTKDAPP